MSQRMSFFILLATVIGLGDTNWSNAEQVGSTIPSLSEIAQRFGIEVIDQGATFPLMTMHGQISGADAGPTSLGKYSRLFAQEFCLYPAALIRSAQLKRVILCTELAIAGQRRNAIPDFENNTLYLEVERGSYNDVYMRKVIHHELFHIIDYQDDGSLYQDQRWSALNPEGFAYGTGGKNAQEIATTSLITEASRGFLNHYSTTGVEEDKAEVFANMIVAPSDIARRVKTDDVLAAKVKMMRQLLVAFCPEMDEEYWSDTLPALRLAQSKLRSTQ